MADLIAILWEAVIKAAATVILAGALLLLAAFAVELLGTILVLYGAWRRRRALGFGAGAALSGAALIRLLLLFPRRQ